MPGKISLQFKFGLSYILVILAVLLLLNTYPLLVSQNLVFRTKQTAMVGSVKIAEAALSGLADLTEDNVAQAMSAVEETGVSRVLVTDTAGRILYDTREGDNARGLYAFYTEIAQALRGNDTFYCRYDGEAFLQPGRLPGGVPQPDRGSSLRLRVRHRTGGVAAELPDQYHAHLSSGGPVRAVPQRSALPDVHPPHQRPAAGHPSGAGGGLQSPGQGDGLTTRSPSWQRSSTASPTVSRRTESARRQFVSDASHELKTPLAGIRLLTDSILQTDDMNAETTREFVADIGEEAQRLTRITEDLLRLTRLDSGAAAEPAPVAVAPVLRRVVRMPAVVAREQETTLSYEADESAVVLATEDDLHQILYNLMENGIKYSGHMGFVHTALTVEGGDVVIRVEDNGVGISDEDMPHIFERFYRVDKARSREVGGTGLGLSIVSDTVRRRGGTVSVAHRPAGQGTLFTVRLPQVTEEGGSA